MDTRQSDGETLASALGWFSIGLGLAQVMAPGRMARLIGVGETRKTRAAMRAIGVREMMAGVGIFASERGSAGWVWTRVAGDAMDLALLGRVLTNGHSKRAQTAAAAAAVVGISALDVWCGEKLSRHSGAMMGSTVASHAVHVKKAITVNRPQDEVYLFWHDLENLPRFMHHLQDVRVTGQGRSHWTTLAPEGRPVEWDTIVIEDVPGELIAWQAVAGSEVANAGSVTFAPAPGGRGTEVRVELEYDPPGGPIGAAFKRLFGEDPAHQIYDDLRAFKQVMETGEIVVSDATVVRGRPHPARPPDNSELARQS